MKDWIPEGSLAYLGIGLQLSGTILAGVFLGYFLDRKFGTLPWGTLIGSGLGLGTGFYNLLSQLNNNQRKNGSDI